MPIEKQVQNIDELVSRLKEEPFFSSLSSVYIDATIQEETPAFVGFPVHYKYRPLVIIQTKERTYKYSPEETSGESPDYEVVRAYVRLKSLEIGADVASRLSEEGARIKINDLPLDQMEKQLNLYRVEFNRVQEAHKDYAWL